VRLHILQRRAATDAFVRWTVHAEFLATKRSGMNASGATCVLGGQEVKNPTLSRYHEKGGAPFSFTSYFSGRLPVQFHGELELARIVGGSGLAGVAE
jgi:hypothetical protein